MAVIAVMLGAIVGTATSDWRWFAVSVIIAFAMQFFTNAWLHEHAHNLYEGEEDEHGVKTIE